MVLPILNAFHPILNQKTSPIDEIDDNLIQLIEDMFETMEKAEGIGLAANQVGKTVSLVVVGDISLDGTLIHRKQAYLNPEIEFFSEETESFNEGCLSIPEIREDVVRPSIIQFRYVDLDGKEHKKEVDGLLSRVLQHEIDHLNGILFVDRIAPFRKALIKNKLRKIRKGLIVPDYPMVLPDGSLIQNNIKIYEK
ncbi:MAG: peptide deformylase [Ignavibacteria bacterium]|nr:peptide deformylase [Ignavibacteria bacterium]